MRTLYVRVSRELSKHDQIKWLKPNFEYVLLMESFCWRKIPYPSSKNQHTHKLQQLRAAHNMRRCTKLWNFFVLQKFIM